MSLPPPQLPSDNLRLVFVSRLCLEKGLDTLCKLNNKIQELNNDVSFTIDFYGQKTDKYFEDNIEHRYKNYKYKGVIAPEDVINVISNYDALIFPTHYAGEGCPGILIEALVAKLLVIASNWKDNAEFIQNGVNGFLCETLNVDDYIKAISSLYYNKNLILQMSNNSYNKSESYSHTSAVNRLTEIFR